MDPLFLTALGVTVVALGVVVVTGHRALRRAHYASVVGFFAALAWAIRLAEIEGRGLVFEGASGVIKQVHFVAVALDFLLVPLLIWSGVQLARREDPGVRGRHRALAAAFVVLVVVTCALGLAMTLTATRVGA